MDFGTHPNSVTGYEKRDRIVHFLIFHFKTHNLESIAATDFNFGVMILISSCSCRKEFCAPPTSGLGGASTQVDHNCHFMPQFGSSLFSTEGLLY